MSKAVVDASAILAVIFTEPGAEKLTDEILDGSVASTVNLAEVQAKLVKKVTTRTLPGKTPTPSLHRRITRLPRQRLQEH